VTTRVTRMVVEHYAGDRPAAQRDCVARFAAATALPRRLDAHQREVLGEVAMVARCLDVSDADGLRLLAQMVRTKPVDVYRYQQQLLAFFSQPRIEPSRP
jgi:hypothetical protein